MAVNSWNKFLLLMWKNWILEKHHKVQLILELIFPALFISCLVFIKSVSQPTKVYEPTTFESELPDKGLSLFRTYSDSQASFTLAYSPNNNFTNTLINETASILNMSFIGFENSKFLNNYLETYDTFVGITFNNDNSILNPDWKHLNYSLRFPNQLRAIEWYIDSQKSTWNINHLYDQVSGTASGPRYPTNPSYINEGFTAVQHAIAMAFIKLHFQETQQNEVDDLLPKIQLQKFPYPPYKSDKINSLMNEMLGPMIIVGVSFVFICGVKYVTDEKEKKLKEFMQIMGLSNWLHWLSWFVKIFTVGEIANGLVLFVASLHDEEHSSFFENSDLSAIYFFLTIYTISTITFSFMMSTFFSKANTATTVSGLFWYITYLPYFSLKNDLQLLSLSQKLACCLFSNSAVCFGFKLIQSYQAIGYGLQWNNMWKPIPVIDSLCVGYIIVMMILDSIIYMMIALYVEKVFPGEYGIPEKWYFPFTKEYWCQTIYDGNLRDTPFEEQDPDAFEAQPIHKRIGIRIKGIEKKFDEITAVKELFVNMYEGEITALLGHNGAGKSTTMSILTGLLPPTSGTAIVNGFDIRKNISSIRRSLGLCPQHNILFDDLTPKEHLIFYSKLKGINRKCIEIEVNKFLKALELENKADEPAKKLSGGMKRKLSVAISLCGNPKVILMDEPTAGMDPSARRVLWNLLQREKLGKTILISTHFMDEADILGDRIAILCDGELKCYGTSFFLKKKFGSGYHLICVKSEACESVKVTELLQKYIPNIQISSEIGKELCYELSDQYSGIFEQMLGELEATSNKLGLSGYGISLTTLEEVFMRIAIKQQHIKEIDDNHEIRHQLEDPEAPCFDLLTHHDYFEKGFQLFLNRCKAMFMKKFLFSIRNWFSFVLQIIIPFIWLSFVTLGSITFGDYLSHPSLVMTLNRYVDAIIILGVTRNGDELPNEWDMKIGIADEYMKFLKNDTKQNYELISINSDFQDYFLTRSANDTLGLKFKYLIAATIEKDNITAWYNNEMLHTAPLSLYLVHNALIRYKLGPDYRIDVTNYPQPPKQSKEDDFNDILGFGVSIFIAFKMCFVTCFYVTMPIKDKISGAKLLQFVAGITAAMYWLTSYLWDLICFTFISGVFLTIIRFLDLGEFSTFQELGRIFLILFFFGIAVIPFTYLVSKLLKDPTTAFSRLWLINVLFGPTVYIVIFAIYQSHTEGSIIEWFLRFIPHYSLTEALFKLAKMIVTRKSVCHERCNALPLPFVCNEDVMCLLNDQCCDKPFLYWTIASGIIWNLLYFCLTAFILMTVIIVHDLGYMNKLISDVNNYIWKPKKHYNSELNIDDDVKSEKELIKTLTMRDINTYNVVLDRVTKYYRKNLAVKEISVGIKQSECFGLLGVNGAGKTTTFKMMTGEEFISSGEIYLKGTNIRNNLCEVYQETGYCPQADALLNEFTGRELLQIFCYIRGIPKHKISPLCMQIAKDLAFQKYLNKLIRSYSGGTKRKLNTAIALIGSPSVIFLDEPSAGMDPSARRHLWNLICRTRDSGKTIILTSHSMEECEALCTRLGIMVNGEFKCLGSTQHLKNKFSKGIILKIKLKNRQDQPRLQSVPEEHPMLNADVENVLRFVGTNFWNATLSEHYDRVLSFHIPLANVRWSKIFGLLENNRELLNLEDYSVSQTTLEQIFLDFANQQRSE